MADDKYTAYSGGKISNAVDSALAAVSNTGLQRSYRAFGEGVEQAVNAGTYAIKLALSEAGIIRSIIKGGARSEREKESDVLMNNDRLKKYEAYSHPAANRYDSGTDYYFKCGGYFMPLSMNFTCRGEKSFAESQLIDGVNIIERVSKRPKIITVNIKIQKASPEQLGYNQGQYTESYDEGSFGPNSGTVNRLRNAPSNMHIVHDSNMNAAISDLSAMFNDLFENQDVFTIENQYINKEMRVTHVVMRNFNAVPGVGSTLLDIQMELYEINMDKNIIYDENANIETGFTLR